MIAGRLRQIVTWGDRTRRTIEDDNIRSGTKLLLDLSKSLGTESAFETSTVMGTKPSWLERFSRPNGNSTPFLLKLVRDGETDVSSRAQNKSN